jgi:serine/threonine protein kinase
MYPEGRFTPIGLIANGAASSVQLVRDARTGRQIAVKVIPPEFWNQSQFYAEIHAMSTLVHPCVTRLRGYCPPDRENQARIWTDFAMNGSLASVLEGVRVGREPDFWDPTGRALIICGIALGMRHVHSMGFIHRDLTPGNILIDADAHALIHDFGTVCREDDHEPGTAEGRTVRYAAPEVFESGMPSRTSCDVFSFGSVPYEVLTGTPVFPAATDPREVIGRLRRGEMPALPHAHPVLMRELIKQCWSKSAESRPSFASILVQFASAEFELLRGVDARKVRKFVEAIPE